MRLLPRKPGKMTPQRIGTAFAIAIAADILQLPVNLAAFTGFFAVPAAGTDDLIDAAAAVALIGVLGFHWVLLPTAVIEAVPLVDDFPTWTACVGYLAWRHREEIRQQRPCPREGLASSNEKPEIAGHSTD